MMAAKLCGSDSPPCVGMEKMLGLSNTILHKLSRKTEQRPPGGTEGALPAVWGTHQHTCRPQLRRQEFMKIKT